MSAKGKRPSSPWQVRTGKQILKQVEDSVFLHYIEFRRASAILNSAQYLSDAQKQRALFVRYCCRSPRGERGLKLEALLAVLTMFQSLPSRGAWIEIS